MAPSAPLDPQLDTNPIGYCSHLYQSQSLYQCRCERIRTESPVVALTLNQKNMYAKTNNDSKYNTNRW